MKKITALLLTALLLAASLAGCGGKGKPSAATEGSGSTGASSNTASSPDKNSSAASVLDDVIKIGVFEPLSGGAKEGGEMTLEGIKLAHELAGEVLGKKVELVLADNASDKKQAAEVAVSLVEQDKVQAIIGSYGSSLSMAAWESIKKAKIPAMGCSPTNPWVTKNNDYYFRVCFIDPFQGSVMAKYAAETLGAKHAAIIQDEKQDYSVGLCKYFEESFAKLTKDPNCIVSTQIYHSGDTDFSKILGEVMSKNPDVIFAPGNYEDSALLIKQARAMGISAPFLGGDTWESQEFITKGGDAVEGATFSSHFSADAPPVTEESSVFTQAYEKKYGKAPNTFAALGFDAYMVVLDAIKRADSVDGDKIREALAKTSGFVGATGIITLDENGDATKDAVINQVENGKFKYITTVKP